MRQLMGDEPPVLFLIASLGVGGSESKTVAVSKALAERGHAVHIAYLNPPATLADRVDSRVHLVCLERRGKWSFATAKRLAEYVRRHEIPVILCVNLYPLLYARAVQWLCEKNPPAFDVLINVTDLPALKHHLQMWLYRFFLPQARQLVFGCKAQMDQWRRVYRLNGTRCVYVYNGVDLERFRKNAVSGHRDDLLSRWGLDPQAYTVGTVGRLYREKNHRDVLRAAARLVARGVHAQVLFAGDGPERDALRAMAADLGLEQRVKFAGELADVRPALLAMDVFVLPSKAVETFSNAALEAMAMGCAVVLSDIGGAREMVCEGKSGYVYPRGDLDGLGHILQHLHDRPELRRSLGDAARAVVEERFSLAHMVDEYERLAFAQ